MLFPAPFGPSNPVMPGPRANETSLTATTLPYQRETWSTCIAGTTGGAGTTGSGAVTGILGSTGTVGSIDVTRSP